MPVSERLHNRLLWLTSLVGRHLGASASLARRLDGLDLSILEVVDCGCGLSASIVSRQVLALPFRRLVSVDGSSTVIDLARRKACLAARHDFLCLNLMELPANFDWQESFDVALCLDVLEHLPKPDAIEFLRQLERIVRRRIVVWLPLGELRVDSDPHGGGNDLELHRSFWQANELAMLGYCTEVLPRFHNARYDALWAVKNLDS